MKTLKICDLHNTEPKAMVPVDIAKPQNTRYNGDIWGYYVENSDYYNIVPNDAKIDKKKVKIIGRICDVNIEDYLSEETRGYIKFLATGEGGAVSPVDKLRLKPSSKEDINARVAHSVIFPEIEAKISKLKEEIGHFYRYPMGNRKELAEVIRRGEPICLDSLELIGYWKKNELHLIQVSTLTEVKIDIYALKLDVFSRNIGILESDVMLNKKALFVGCGSVGSLIAVELAKAGVGSFMLVDMDVFNYHNICRHQCGIYDVGKYKTDAVSERILQINPYAKITKCNCAIQDVDVDVLNEFCTEDTIVIGGADNRDGDHYICQFAMRGGGAFVSIGCWERAFAGEIFYCLPGMPDYSDFLNAIGYVSGRVTQNRRFYTTEEELEKVSFEPGISADINFVTIIAVKIVLDLLNRNNRNFTQRLVPHITQYTLVCNTNETSIGGDQAEIFSYPLQVSTSIVVPFSQK